LAKYIVDPKARQLDVAAVWLPDKEANACMICEFARFSTFNRRVSRGVVALFCSHQTFLSFRSTTAASAAF